MATSEQIKASIRSHSEGDNSRFYSIALQMAAQAAHHGHAKLADELRLLIDNAKEKGSEVTKSFNVTNIRQPQGELAGLLSVVYPEARFSSLILTEQNIARLNRIIIEQRQKDKLAEHGLLPRRKILLYGPPGTGKTLTASALAGELHLPLYSIQLDGLITKFMGETAAKLRLIFDHIGKVHGVYFFDEFDAIGAHRTSQNDVGEIRRVLNSFLQSLEQSHTDSIILAATNNLELLDKALFRRFDDVIEYTLPDKKLAIEAFKNRLAIMGIKDLDYEKLAVASAGFSFAEISNACNDAIKSIILNEIPNKLTTSIMLLHLEERRNSIIK